MIEISDQSQIEEYGYFLNIDTSDIVSYLHNKSNFPKENNLYVRDEECFHDANGIEAIKESVFGNGDIEVGYCNGYNHKLNCLEYHACPEVDIAGDDQILLLALKKDIVDGVLDSKKVKAFYLKKGQALVLYPYTLHFSPCRIEENGFHCAIILSDKTNMDLEKKPEDKMLWKVNKWLLAMDGTIQANAGAYIGIKGENIDTLC